MAAAIRAAHRGEVHLDPAIAGRLIRALQAPSTPPPGSGLTERERQVLRLVAAGQANKDIAAELNISERTARTHVSSSQGQFQHAEAVVCDLDGCDLAAAFHLVERVAATHIPVLAISASAVIRTQALARGAAACADKSAAALEELVRQLADPSSSNQDDPAG